MVAVNRL